MKKKNSKKTQLNRKAQKNIKQRILSKKSKMKMSRQKEEVNKKRKRVKNLKY